MSTDSAPEDPFNGRPLVAALAVMALLLAAANLRGGIVVVGPLVEQIRASLAISASAFSLLTTLPLLCFGILSLCVPALSRRWSPQVLAIAGLLVISFGVLLRLAGDYALVLLGTLLLGAAIALLNVLIPGLVKAFFPRRVGLMTGLYSVTLSTGAGLGVYLAVPLQEHFGHWHYPVALWAVLPLLCVLFWLPMLRVKGVGRPANPVRVSLWRDRLAWAITFYMGLQSFYFYSMATWLPKILLESGLNAHEAGTATALINLVSIPFNFLVPILAARLASQRRLVVSIFIASFAGLAGLWWQPAAAPLLWASLIGVGCGGALSLALSFFVLRASNTAQATALSAMAQSVGYLLAAAGPAALGLLRDWQDAWQGALLLLMVLQLWQLGCGWFAARPVQVVPDQQK
ncbi:MFS transporter [Oceanimonas pelagia]|uniref:MFS transporter n=1 Tax=Oceanimonas pelagia TaxID=3028314 RepID=A0AA50KLQ8_9GAMM|nr:MFS transporter [Oceanimonas pelagia]WMC09342.1 MFS transporter [Oceanimonas pelagia]